MFLGVNQRSKSFIKDDPINVVGPRSMMEQDVSTCVSEKGRSLWGRRQTSSNGQTGDMQDAAIGSLGSDHVTMSSPPLRCQTCIDLGGPSPLLWRAGIIEAYSKENVSRSQISSFSELRFTFTDGFSRRRGSFLEHCASPGVG